MSVSQPPAVDGFIVMRRDGTLRCVAVSREDCARVEAAGPWCVHRGSRTFYAKRYIRRDGRYTAERLHRFVLGLAPGDPREVDHIDGNGLNNARENLRVVTRAEQCQNMVRPPGTSRHRGVCWDKATGKWLAQLQVKGRQLRLGRFQSEVDAARAARRARTNHFTHANEARHPVAPEGALDSLEEAAGAP